MPIVGIAPIMVMWFGFDWQSKAAVIVVVTFFPMLVNTLAGLASVDAMQRDLMHSYAASYWQTLTKLRLPAALPFVFNALKINSTLALISAIVADSLRSWPRIVIVGPSGVELPVSAAPLSSSSPPQAAASITIAAISATSSG